MLRGYQIWTTCSMPSRGTTVALCCRPMVSACLIRHLGLSLANHVPMLVLIVVFKLLVLIVLQLGTSIK